MTLQYTTVRNPQYASADGQNIYCSVTFPDHPHFKQTVELPFNAVPNDIEDHGREIYERAVTGEFGPVAPFGQQSG